MLAEEIKNELVEQKGENEENKFYQNPCKICINVVE